MVKSFLALGAMSASRRWLCHLLDATSLLRRFPYPRVAARSGMSHSLVTEKRPVRAGLGGNRMTGFCRALACIPAALAAVYLSAAAQAQVNYPDRPVNIIVPIGPGGSYDLVGRLLAEALSKRTAKTFFVENKPGAGTVVGTQVAAQSNPDGYTLMVGGLSNMAFNSALYSKLGYDPLKDFVPVALVYRFGYVMVGRKDLPQTRLADIVAAAKAGPGSITVATAGVGTGQQLGAGVPGLDVDSWLGIFVPAKTPPEIVAKLRTELRASLPDLKERFEKSGGEVWDMPDDRLEAFIASEYENWTKLIREAGIKLD